MVPYRVKYQSIWQMEHESKAEVNSLLSTEMLGSWRTSVIGVVKGKTEKKWKLVFVIVTKLSAERMMLFVLLVHSRSCLQTFSPR